MSLAALRGSPKHDELAQLAETHFKNDLTQDDREVLKGAAKTLNLHATVGSVLGLGVGCLLAYRARRLRHNWFHQFQATEKPAQVVFRSGKTGESLLLQGRASVACGESGRELTRSTVDVPDVTDLVAPSRAGDFAAYFFLGLGGLFLGGETGLLSGTSMAWRKVKADEERRRRVENAYRAFKVDMLHKEIYELERGGNVW